MHILPVRQERYIICNFTHDSTGCITVCATRAPSTAICILNQHILTHLMMPSGFLGNSALFIDTIATLTQEYSPLQGMVIVLASGDYLYETFANEPPAIPVPFVGDWFKINEHCWYACGIARHVLTHFAIIKRLLPLPLLGVTSITMLHIQELLRQNPARFLQLSPEDSRELVSHSLQSPHNVPNKLQENYIRAACAFAQEQV